jgi:hypothetical protein
VHTAGHKLLHGVPTTDKFGGLNKIGIPRVIVAAIEWGLHPKVKTTHVRRYFGVEPRFCPPDKPFVLDGQTQLRPDAPSGMKIYAAKLLILLNPVSIHLFWLIMQLIALRETVAVGFTVEAKAQPKNIWKTERKCSGKAGEAVPRTSIKYLSVPAAAASGAQ